MLLYQWIAMPLLPRQSKTPYGTPFYAIASLYCNILGCPPPIYDPLQYSFYAFALFDCNTLGCPINL